MKAALVNILIAIPLLSFGQISQSYQIDTCNFHSKKTYTGNEKYLPILKIDSCFFDILSTIVDKDSICSYFKKDNTAYIFSINKQKGFYTIAIRPVYLDCLIQADYFGIIEFHKREFFCWGCRLDTIFKESSSASKEVKFNLDDSSRDFYLGGDVPSKKQVVTCKGTKFYFEITASCNNRRQP